MLSRLEMLLKVLEKSMPCKSFPTKPVCDMLAESFNSFFQATYGSSNKGPEALEERHQEVVVVESKSR